MDYGDRLEVVYIVYDTARRREEVVGVRLEPESPEIVTVMNIYKAADWYEREMSEMFGIRILGRKADRLLLEKWNGKGTPLRKSFGWGKPYERRGGG